MENLLTYPLLDIGTNQYVQQSVHDRVMERHKNSCSGCMMRSRELSIAFNRRDKCHMFVVRHVRLRYLQPNIFATASSLLEAVNQMGVTTSKTIR